MPIALDTSALRRAGNVFTFHAADLEKFFTEWVEKYQAAAAKDEALQDYLATYGSITPFVILPLPAGVPRESLPEHLDSGSVNGLSAAGRLIVANVAGEDASGVIYPSPIHLPPTGMGLSTSLWRQLELGANHYPPTLNASPIQRGSAFKLFDFAAKRSTASLRAWRRAKKSHPPEGTYVPPNAKAEIFVSYSRRDASRVYDICDYLNADGLRLWLDRTSIVGGENWRQSVSSGIDQCSTTLPFCSRAHSDSENCQREVAVAQNRKKRIIPVWLTNPALFGPMEVMLILEHAIQASGLPADKTAALIREHL